MATQKTASLTKVEVKIHRKCKTTPNNKTTMLIGQTIFWESINGTFFLFLPGGIFENQEVPFVQKIEDSKGFQPTGGLKAISDGTITDYVYDVDGVNCVAKITVSDLPEIVIGSGIRRKKKKKKS